MRQLKAEARAYDIVVRNLATQHQLVDHGDEEERSARQGFVNLLRKRRDGNLDRLFRLLGLRYRPEDIIPIYRGLATGAEPETAVEFLDNLLEPKLKLVIVPILEQGLRSPTIITEQNELDYLLKTQRRNLRAVMNGRDLRQKMAALYLIGTLGDEEYLPVLARYRGNREKRIRDLAGRAMEGIVSG